MVDGEGVSSEPSEPRLDPPLEPHENHKATQPSFSVGPSPASNLYETHMCAFLGPIWGVRPGPTLVPYWLQHVNFIQYNQMK